jgi:DNA-directed RNA polymerase subunit RPC12/RpoP
LIKLLAVYICGKCQFCFERVGEVTACEDCGHINVRLADDEEIAEYERIKAEIANEQMKSDA